MDFSILLSRSLDVLGYSQDMIRHRVDFWKLNESIYNNGMQFDHAIIYSGSQKEGVVASFGSDIDMMDVNNTVICANNPLPFIDNRNTTLFQTDNQDTEPGYTKLKLIKIGKPDSSILESLFQSENGETYISSKLFTDMYLTASRIQHKNPALSKAGPAVPFPSKFTLTVVDDMVFCFKCYCPDLLRSWLRRPRRYDWPSPNIIYDISQMESHVVPVGCKGSDTYYQEWRICFTKAEIHIVHSLNDTQVKLYIILKMIAKTILKNICPEITSYIMKNVVFWMFESLPNESFSEYKLVNRIFQALQFLRKCVTKNCLPCYMIPERNLFHGRIELEQQRKLIESLSSFKEEGPAAMFYRLDKICGAMSLLYQNPLMADYYMIKRNVLDKLVLLRMLRLALIISPDMAAEKSEQVLSQDELYTKMLLVILTLVLPNWREKRNAQAICDERLRQYLS